MNRKVTTGYITAICQNRNSTSLLSLFHDSKIHSLCFVDNALLTLLGVFSIIRFRT